MTTCDVTKCLDLRPSFPASRTLPSNLRWSVVTVRLELNFLKRLRPCCVNADVSVQLRVVLERCDVSHTDAATNKMAGVPSIASVTCVTLLSLTNVNQT